MPPVSPGSRLHWGQSLLGDERVHDALHCLSSPNRTATRSPAPGTSTTRRLPAGPSPQSPPGRPRHGRQPLRRWGFLPRDARGAFGLAASTRPGQEAARTTPTFQAWLGLSPRLGTGRRVKWDPPFFSFSLNSSFFPEEATVSKSGACPGHGLRKARRTGTFAGRLRPPLSGLALLQAA